MQLALIKHHRKEKKYTEGLKTSIMPPKKNAVKVNDLSPRIQSELAASPFLKKTEPFLAVKHCANLGDVIAALPAIKKYSEITGLKIKFLQVLNFPGEYFKGAAHPTKNEDGIQVCMNEKMFKMIKPLVESQSYIHSFDVYDGQLIDLDLDVIRTKVYVGMPNLMIQSWVMFAYPDLGTDLSKAWIKLKPVKNHPVKKLVEGKVILNFTERYHSENLDYLFLREYVNDLVFAGTRSEHDYFCKRWQINVPILEVKDFLEYAYALKYAKFIFCNQSFGWNLAQAMGTPRLVELCRFALNVQPYIGEKSLGFFNQTGATYGFRELFKNT